MGREIRQVPANWEHPKDDKGRYVPINDEDYETVITEWIRDHNLWMIGKHPDQIEDSEAMAKYEYYAEWYGDAPGVEYYHPKWTDEERTHYQVYETVTEGTPVTPSFKTKAELINYLVEHGTYWDTKGYNREIAERFAEQERVPSMIMTGNKMFSGINCAAIISKEEEQSGA